MVVQVNNLLIRMFKKRYFSTQNDFKTGFFCKITIFFGLVLLFIFIFSKISAIVIGENSTGFLKEIYDFSQTSYPNSIFAFSIILLAIGVILYFFHCQFSKLAKIADEIEKSENMDNID